jgi:V8-like Glu-specific endopeptidase
MLHRDRDGNYWPFPRALAPLGLCEDVRFFEQESLANCSASLISEDLILTAAHCIEEQGADKCGDYHVVFDYALGRPVEMFSAEQVYHCKEVLYYRFDSMSDVEDLAVIRLDRKVPHRTPLRLAEEKPSVKDPVTLLGYPLGLPLKFVDDGEVTDVRPLNLSFRHNLDTFSCNSGGPTLNERGEVVGVLVRGTSQNMQRRGPRQCYDWGVAASKDFAESNTIDHLPRAIPALRN